MRAQVIVGGGKGGGQWTLADDGYLVQEPDAFDVPSQDGQIEWNGKPQSPTWKCYDSGYMTLGGVVSATEPGAYEAEFTLKAGLKWEDGTSEPKGVTWRIGKKSIPLPEPGVALVYNGAAQSPEWIGYDAASMSIGGSTSSTNAGAFSATFTLSDPEHCAWAAGARTAQRSVDWAIAKQPVAVPTQMYPLTYTGRAQSPTWSGPMELIYHPWTEQAVNAGTYSATMDFNYNDRDNHCWKDTGESGSRNVPWKIDKQELNPRQSNTLTYTGAAQSPEWSGYDPATMSINRVSATDAGSYKALCVVDGANCALPGGGDSCCLEWKIGKAELSGVSIDKTSLSLTVGSSADVTVTCPDDCTVEATPEYIGNTDVTAIVNGKVVTITKNCYLGSSRTILIAVRRGTNYETIKRVSVNWGY